MNDIELNRDVRKLKNMIRVGDVSSVNPETGRVKVRFADKDNFVSKELALLDSEYNLPNVGDQVLCVFLPNGIEEGFCLNGFYSKKNPPPVTDSNLYHKKLDDGLTITYDKATKQLTINAENPIQINGDVHVNGTLTSTS